MDESDHRIGFNLLTKSVISLSAAIGASSSPLGPNPKGNLAIDLYFGSTPIAIKDGSNRRINQQPIAAMAYGSPPGTPPKIDLIVDLYSGSAVAVHYDEIGPSDCSDLFMSLNT
jgi:hypothetical protein